MELPLLPELWDQKDLGSFPVLLFISSFNQVQGLMFKKKLSLLYSVIIKVRILL